MKTACLWHHLHPLFTDGVSLLGSYLRNNYQGQFTAGQEVQIICCQIQQFGKTQMTWGNLAVAGGKIKPWRNKLNHLSHCLSSRGGRKKKKLRINYNCNGAVVVAPVVVADRTPIWLFSCFVLSSVKLPHELRVIFILAIIPVWHTYTRHKAQKEKKKKSLYVT